MIKKLQKKTACIITLILWIILIATIVVVDGAGYYSMERKAKIALKSFEENTRAEYAGHRKNEGQLFDEFTMHTVFMDSSGCVVFYKSDSGDMEEIFSVANQIAGCRQSYGEYGRYRYRISGRRSPSGVIQVTFLERSLIIQQEKEKLVFSIVILVVGMLLLGIFSVFLVRWLTKPVEENIKKQESFVSMASHELKTPLTVIGVNAEMLYRRPGEEKYLDYIQAEVKKMSKLVNEMLIMASAENQIYAQQTIFSISDVFSRVVAHFEAIAEERRITIYPSVQNEIFFYGSEVQLERVIMILLDNAVKYTKPGERIDAGLQKNKSKISIFVGNSGTEIPPDQQERIFERFYRMDASGNRKGGHYGLGLSIAKAIVLQYSGKISVKSKKGYTMFEVVLPCREKKIKE